jgi:hypothetical protein
LLFRYGQPLSSGNLIGVEFSVYLFDLFQKSALSVIDSVLFEMCY